MSSENFKLDREIDAAKLLRASLADVLKDDEDFAADVVEGQTGLIGAIQSAVTLYCQDKTSVDAIEAHIAIMEARKTRLKRRMEMTRTLVGTALEVSGRKSVETPLGTALLKAVPAKLHIEPDHEHEIPLDYWKRGDPALDRKKLLADLKDGKEVAGVRLETGNSTVSFVFR